MEEIPAAGAMGSTVRLALAFACLALGGTGAARASFVTTTRPPDLFPSGSFIAGGPSVCIASGPLRGVCTSNERTTILSSSVDFPGNGDEDIVLDGLVTGDTANPAGSFALTGTEDLTIVGRAAPYQTGVFAIDVTAEDFAGSFFGHTIELSLDPDGPHDGRIAISQLAGQDGYLIDTTLVIAHQISVDGGPPTPIGTAHATVAVPEPAASWLWGLPLAALLRSPRRRAAAAQAQRSR